MEIKLQKQVQPNGCMSACLAMLLGRPVSDVSAEFNTKYHGFEAEPVEYAQQHGLTLHYPEPSAIMNVMFPGKVYIIAVPSLNTPGMLHTLLMDMRDVTNINLYDPANGQQYEVHTKYDGEPGTTELVSWMVMYEVIV